MSLMERVREIGADEAQMSDESIRMARTALTREIARSRRPERLRRTRRRWTGIGIGSLAAGVAATAIVVGSVVAPVRVADAAAAEVLEQAAQVTVNAQDTTLLPGQYLRVDEQSEFLQFWREDWADDEDENTFAFNASREGADAAVLVREARTLYVPADRAADWYYDWGTIDVAQSFGESGLRAADEWASWPGATPRENGSIETLPAGQFLATDGDTPNQPYLADSYRPYYGEMPREPQALLNWLRSGSGMGGAEADQWLVAGLSDPSKINLMPADLRASFFRAMALIPGFDVVDVDDDDDDDVTTLRYAVPGHRMTSIELDTGQGLIESISESYGAGGVTGATPESLTRVSISVVDSAP